MKVTYQEFKERQNWNLHQKIDHTVGTIERFLAETDGNAFVSFSGGKDSTVLLDIARRFIDKKFLGVFSNTGNEYPETVQFVRSFDNLTIIRPQMKVKEVLDKYGFPLISKEQSQYIRQARNTKSEKLRDIRLNGKPIKSGKGGIGGKISEKWKFVIQAPFEVSEMCCYKLKKEPFELYHKQTGLNPIIGTTAEESRLRLQKYLKTGCNDFDSKKIASYPLSIWTEMNIWEYIRKFEIPYSPIYNVPGVKQTGCMFCGYGCQEEKGCFNRFDILNYLHPKAYQSFMNYTNSGVTYREALEYIGIILPDSPHRQIPLFGITDFLK